MRTFDILFKSFLLLLFTLSACTKKENPKPEKEDFVALMGSSLPAWKHVQTKEDFDNLNFFKKIYDDNKPLLATTSKKSKIPKTLHFIWVGPKPFPRESIENVRTWIAKNPDWEIKFWTDRDRPLPHPCMKKMLLKDFTFTQLGDCYFKSDNFGEKSDILRYEILFQEGGVYVDHDVKCFKPFSSLNIAYDFYCGMEVPYPTSLSSSVLPTNNIVASRASHPILKYTLDWLSEKWDKIEKDYPGKDRDSVINRVSHRTFFVLGEALRTLGNRNGNNDMVFPAFYFNAPQENQAIMARHQYAGTWFENESTFEKNARKRLMMLSKKTNKILLFLGLSTVLNLAGFAFFFILFNKRRKPVDV